MDNLRDFTIEQANWVFEVNLRLESGEDPTPLDEMWRTKAISGAEYNERRLIAYEICTARFMSHKSSVRLMDEYKAVAGTMHQFSLDEATRSVERLAERCRRVGRRR